MAAASIKFIDFIQKAHRSEFSYLTINQTCTSVTGVTVAVVGDVPGAVTHRIANSNKNQLTQKDSSLKSKLSSSLTQKIL